MLGVGAGLVLMLAACGTTDKEEDTTEENGEVEVGETLANYEGGEYTGGELLNDLVISQALEEDAVLDLLLQDLVTSKFKPKDEDVQKELDIVKEELDEMGVEGEERENAEKETEENIREFLSLKSAISSVYEVSDEEVKEEYDKLKDKYTVVDIISYGEMTDEKQKQIDDIVKGVEGKTVEEANEFVESQELTEDTQAIVTDYAKSELPLGEESQEKLKEVGDTVEVESEGVYNQLILLKQEELTFEELEKDIQDFVLINKVTSHYELLDNLQENNEDITFDDYVNDIIERGLNGELNQETGLPSQQLPEGGEQGEVLEGEEVPSVIQEGIEEEESAEPAETDSE